jgi:hypothetical protein
MRRSKTAKALDQQLPDGLVLLAPVAARIGLPCGVITAHRNRFATTLAIRMKKTAPMRVAVPS